jgi:hypothetical protein
MPEESKMKVLTSDSAPWAGISWPFQRKVTPAALPTLATIWRVARMEVWAGAMRVSSLAGCPSAVTEIQEVSVARIVRVSDAAAGDEGRGVGEAAEFVAEIFPVAFAGWFAGAATGARGVAGFGDCWGCGVSADGCCAGALAG